MAIRVGIDLGLFDSLSQANGPVTAAQLASQCGAEHFLLGEALLVKVTLT